MLACGCRYAKPLLFKFNLLILIYTTWTSRVHTLESSYTRQELAGNIPRPRPNRPSSQLHDHEISNLRKDGESSSYRRSTCVLRSTHQRYIQLLPISAYRRWVVWGSRARKADLWNSMQDPGRLRHVSTFESTSRYRGTQYRAGAMARSQGFLQCTGSAVRKRAACRCTQPTNKHVLRSGTKPRRCLDFACTDSLAGPLLPIVHLDRHGLRLEASTRRVVPYELWSQSERSLVVVRSSARQDIGLSRGSPCPAQL